MKKALNVKNMKETLVNYSGDIAEFDKIWDSFYMMHCTGFITADEWKKFYDACSGWYITEDGSAVLDSNRNDALVWFYTSDAEYRA